MENEVQGGSHITAHSRFEASMNAIHETTLTHCRSYSSLTEISIGGPTTKPFADSARETVAAPENTSKKSKENARGRRTSSTAGSPISSKRPSRREIA